MSKVWYVIDCVRGYVSHQSSSYGECSQYISNACWTSGHKPSRYAIANGAKDRDAYIKAAKASQ